jgi:hypothetical protein
MFFFEKKNQKTFVCDGQHQASLVELFAASKEQKFFASFFQKRRLPC